MAPSGERTLRSLGGRTIRAPGRPTVRSPAGRSRLEEDLSEPTADRRLSAAPGSSRERLPALLVLASLGLGALAGLLGPMFGAFLGLALALFLLVTFPAAGLGVLVAARSSLDRFYEVSIVPGPFPLNPASALGLGLILLAGLVLVLKARVRSRIDWGGRIGGLWSVWLTASGFALVVGYLGYGGGVAAAGTKEFVRLASFYAIFLLVANLAATGRGNGRWLVWACFAGLLVPCAFGIYQLILGGASHNVHGVRRIVGTFVHPNPFGIYLAGLSFLGAGFLMDLPARFSQRAILLLLVAMSSTLLLFTYSRSALGVALVAFVIWAVWGSIRRRILVLGGMGLAALLLFPVLAWRFQDLFVDLGQGPVTGEDVTNSFAWRLINYQRLLGSFRESPIVGHGLTAISEINPTRTRTVDGFDAGFAAHNEIVRVLVEQGILGFLVWMVVAIGIWRAIGALTAQQRGREFGGHPRTGEALRALFLTLFLLSGVGMAFLNQTVLLYVIFTVLGALRVGVREAEPGGPPVVST